MAGAREPIGLVVSKGAKHLTKTEIAARRAEEVHAHSPRRVGWPEWLPKELRASYNAYSKALVALDIFTELDRDSLGRYLVAHKMWLSATARALAALKAGDPDGTQLWSGVQDRYFKQCRGCAADLGLTISSRCKLVVPEAPEGAGGNPFLELLERRNAKNA